MLILQIQNKNHIGCIILITLRTNSISIHSMVQSLFFILDKRETPQQLALCGPTHQIRLLIFSVTNNIELHIGTVSVGH
jgi:hypothetical protein